MNRGRSHRGEDGHGPADELEPIDLRPPPPTTPAFSMEPAAPARPAPRPHTLRATRIPVPPETDVAFRRWVFAPLEACVTRLERWAAGTSPNRRVGRNRVVLEPATPGEPDQRHLSVLLHRGWRRPPLPMDLVVDRSSAPFGAQLTLRPHGTVKGGRRYFREGHAVLNVVEDILEACGGPVRTASRIR